MKSIITSKSKKLEADGNVFLTESDTETLQKLISVYGLSGLKHIEGMWAFAYFDRKKHKLSLARDVFGEKPLYYFFDKQGNLYFGSEIIFIKSL